MHILCDTVTCDAQLDCNICCSWPHLQKAFDRLQSWAAYTSYICCLLLKIADVADLQLGELDNIIVHDGSNHEQFAIQMGMLMLEASFGSLAWPGVYAKTKITPFGAVIHAQIVGAQVGQAECIASLHARSASSGFNCVVVSSVELGLC